VLRKHRYFSKAPMFRNMRMQNPIAKGVTNSDSVKVANIASP
jgi:hypothetical protein